MKSNGKQEISHRTAPKSNKRIGRFSMLNFNCIETEISTSAKMNYNLKHK
jgi:hypothetical protein